ncbi:hypothetical protein ANN_04717 [Periplaneta americana]|uniref:Endonuclease/exonuclease/phosphatase domain-containing protein n=1 Tax=Periplaneta americana TaxID=6978 RepID=A0ABQ8T966_PERAM|nr:hypothetical protein ANN_04717 [Periplaneta americana]
MPATQGPRGRSMRDISCYYKQSLGKVLSIHQEQDTMIINFKRIFVIAIYVEPLTPIEELIATIMSARGQVAPGRDIILARDLNCELDNANYRAKELMELMTEEGFILVNKAEDRTYVAQSGSSTIDLIFFKDHNIMLMNYSVCYATEEVMIKKHCPVLAHFNVTKMERREKYEDTHTSR